MSTTRRGFLGALASLPVVSALARAKVEPEAPESLCRCGSPRRAYGLGPDHSSERILSCGDEVVFACEADPSHEVSGSMLGRLEA